MPADNRRNQQQQGRTAPRMPTQYYSSRVPKDMSSHSSFSYVEGCANSNFKAAKTENWQLKTTFHQQQHQTSQVLSITTNSQHRQQPNTASGRSREKNYQSRSAVYTPIPAFGMQSEATAIEIGIWDANRDQQFILKPKPALETRSTVGS
ncbi:hypothetical protein Nepgr_013528 [Nepenthes gracilis]|uniref:Uncharacterized protein n=1 Tax=Nepenthes gracilis TaxID=150966 RepID=A0AAD3SJA8_NEPGR|nr:hypothetical protein Nepgr_013528 [Nepenthes gracilis]